MLSRPISLNSSRPAVWLWLLLLASVSPLAAVDQDMKEDDSANVAKALRLPAGFAATLFAQHPLFGNPVAIDVDPRGRVFVAEQYRFNRGTEENRTSSFLLDDDLQVQTTDERLAMFRKWSSRYEGGMAWFTKVSDQVRVVSDDDGDGKADRSTVLAQFNEPLDGLNAGVMVIGDDIWVTCIPNLWRLRDRDDDGIAEERVKVHSGFGVKASFLGHDLHALTLGMDGRLYLSIGDRGLHVVNREGATLHVPDHGAVLRCELDGSQLEVVHKGLRNPQGLAFDEFGNLFAGDNNCDKGDKSRLIYVVDGGDSAWRMPYQSMDKPVSGGPWMAEELWQTESPLHPQWSVPGVGYIGAGPSGLRFSAVGAWPEKLRNRFFHMNFTGNSGIITFKTVNDGAGFRIAEYQDFLTPMNVSDCAFGYDGRLYVANYTGNPFNHDVGGRLFAVGAAETPKAEIEQLRVLAKADIKAFSNDRLVTLLDHADQRIRLRAQFALAAQPKSQSVLAGAAANRNASLMIRLHAAWGLWMMARADAQALAPLRLLAADQDPQIRANAFRVLADLGDRGFTAGFIAGLNDAELRVRFFAAEGLGRSHAAATAPLIALLRRNAGKDRFIQHAAVTALGRIGNREALMASAQDPDAAVRLAVVLTLRLWGDARLAGFLADADDRIVLEAARAIHEVRITAAYPALAAAGARAGRAAEPFRAALQRRVLASARRLADRDGAGRLVQIMVDPAVAVAVRVTASELLADWTTVVNRDSITGAWWPLPAGDVAAVRDAMAGRIDALFAANLVDTWATSFTALTSVGIAVPVAIPTRIANDGTVGSAARIAAFTYAQKSAPAAAADIAQGFLRQGKPELQSVALTSLRAADQAVAVELFAKLLGEQATPLSVKQTCLDELATIASAATPASAKAVVALLDWGKRLSSTQIPPELAFDVLAAVKRSRAAAPELDKLITAYDVELATNKDPLAPYLLALDGGNSERGAQVFATHPVAQCTRCHAVNGQGGVAGPNLSHIATTLSRRELLDSLIVPSARIAPGYGLITVTTTTGQTLTGMIVSETPTQLVIEIAKDQRTTLAITDIASRTKPISLMPPVGQILQPRELRDVLAYMQSLK